MGERVFIFGRAARSSFSASIFTLNQDRLPSVLCQSFDDFGRTFSAPVAMGCAKFIVENETRDFTRSDGRQRYYCQSLKLIWVGLASQKQLQLKYFCFMVGGGVGGVLSLFLLNEVLGCQ